MGLEQFTQLREHLDSIRPIFDQYCLSARYSHVDDRSIGRYPRIRIEHDEGLVHWIDFWMSLDANGNRFSEFFDTIPYELSTGASFVEVKNGRLLRYQKSTCIYSSKPFIEVPPTLLGDLNICSEITHGWTFDTVRMEGEMVELPM